MKVIREKKTFRMVNLRLSDELLEKLDKVAEQNEISRQRVIEAILDQVLDDKTFVLRIKD